MSPAFSPSLKAQVVDRDGAACVICGVPSTEVHHRAGRGMGGSKAANRVGACMVVCRRHNWLMESDAAFMGLAYRRGWKVRRHGVRTPEDVAVWYPAEQEWFLLGDDGARVRPAAEVLPRYLPDGADNEGPTTGHNS